MAHNLYIAEARRQLSDTSSYCPLNYDPKTSPNQSSSTDTLIGLTELILTLNNFSFNSSHFLQTKGVAMDTRMGPSCACLFIGYDLYLSNCLNINIYFKPTNSHSYLDYTFSHPPTCKNAIPYSQFLRICAQDGAFHSRTSQISSYFKDRIFPPPVIKNALNRISCISCTSALKPPPP
eukprot:g21432.t1